MASKTNNIGWQDVIDSELEAIGAGRSAIENEKAEKEAGEPRESAKPDNLVGLAFSGGGIRSATFNLGVIQALAELRLLRKFDYLSTVSGGGYIGSWLSSWMASHDQTEPDGQQKAEPPWLSAGLKLLGDIRRSWETQDKRNGASKSIIEIENELAPPGDNNKPELAAGKSEPGAVRHLRSYTDYLKPHGGLFSLDAMTAFTTWLRNSLLNQLILALVFAATLLLPLALGSFIKYLIYGTLPPGSDYQFEEFLAQFSDNSWVWLLASFFLAVAIGFINVNILYKPAIENPKLPWYSSRQATIILIVLPLVLCAFLLSVMLPSLHQFVDEIGYVNFIKSVFQFSLWPITPPALFRWMLVFCGIAFIASSPVRLIFLKNSNRRESSVWIYGLVFVAAAIFGVLLLAVIAKLIMASVPTHFSGAVVANLLMLGPPLILFTFMLAVFVYVGLLGRKFDKQQREWWSRLVAMVSFVAAGWLVHFAISLWGALAIDYLKIGLVSVFSWVGVSALGAALGKSASVLTMRESKGANKWLSLAAQIAPFIFIVGLCLLVAYVLNLSLMYYLSTVLQVPVVDLRLHDDAGEFTIPYYFRLYQLYQIFGIGPELILVAVALFLAAVLFSWRVDINVFSFHNFYRNRLARAYLAAGVDEKERDRTKLPLTGMSDMDSPRLDRLPLRPYHILNTALNITRGDHLSWKERKAASFFFSRNHCGYFLQGSEREHYYCSTGDFLGQRGWLSLSLPMTISGAAASPNGGYHTVPPLAFLMTVFNVRLGWWMQNTAEKAYWYSKGPKFGLRYLLKELWASADEKCPFVYLSDGGHFENLGIYELVRRKCRLIVACDAGADPAYEFEDLGNAIRKCYIDLGARIDIDTSRIKPPREGENKGRSLQQSAIGLIHYPDGEKTGVLLYIKASMGKAEAADIENYKAEHPEFPHDPTANQFFTESQFESYRKLGYTLCRRVFDDLKSEDESRGEIADALDIIAQCLGRPYMASV